VKPRPARVARARRSRLGRIGRAAWLVALPLVVVGLLKVFVADVYRVDSGSMEPTIRGPGPGGFEATGDGGEAVLVRYAETPRLERHDLVVVLRADEREPIVKRVVGLPGEELRIRDGDLLIDGRKLDPRAPRPPLIPIFDSLRHPLRKYFELEGAWDDAPGDTPGGDPGAVEAPGIGGLSAGGAPARACWRGGLNDDRLDSAGLIVRGREPVGDAALECAVRLLGTGGVLSLSLTEEGDVFELRLAPTRAKTPNGDANGDAAVGPESPLLVRVELLRRGDETLGSGWRRGSRPRARGCSAGRAR
jgi:signal peptidase I